MRKRTIKKAAAGVLAGALLTGASAISAAYLALEPQDDWLRGVHLTLEPFDDWVRGAR